MSSLVRSEGDDVCDARCVMSVSSWMPPFSLSATTKKKEKTSSGAPKKKKKLKKNKVNEKSVPKSIVFPDCDRVQNRKSLLPRRETDKKTNDFKT